MSKFTALDRKALVRVAHSLHKGSAERRAILAGLLKVSEALPRDIFLALHDARPLTDVVTRNLSGDRKLKVYIPNAGKYIIRDLEIAPRKWVLYDDQGAPIQTGGWDPSLHKGSVDLGVDNAAVIFTRGPGNFPSIKFL